MFVCPLCNGLATIVPRCSACEHTMKDQGRVVDYLDDYSPYLADEGLKLVDGNLGSKDNHLCIHLFQCLDCAKQEQLPISEVSQ